MSEEFWRDRAGSWRARAIDAEIDRDALRTRLAEAERVANQYAWLWGKDARVLHWNGEWRVRYDETQYGYEETPPFPTRDEAIDAAMREAPITRLPFNGSGQQS